LLEAAMKQTTSLY